MDDQEAIKHNHAETGLSQSSPQSSSRHGTLPYFEPPPSHSGTGATINGTCSVKHDEKGSDSSHGSLSDHGISVQDSPVLEIIALVVSIVILVGITVLLHRYNGGKQPDWDHLSLNTVVAWLSTICKGCILLLASRSLGQLKWVWFAERK